jgi:hypothetical protein
MAKDFVIRGYWKYFIGSWLSYFLLLLVVRSFKLYEWFPGIAFLGYAVVIILQLVALNFSKKRLDYILLSVSLIIIGAIASLDMILHKQQMAELWVLWGWFPLTPSHIDGYMQALIILLNIFTGSIAAQSLFYGLNRRSFESRKE